MGLFVHEIQNLWKSLQHLALYAEMDVQRDVLRAASQLLCAGGGPQGRLRVLHPGSGEVPKLCPHVQSDHEFYTRKERSEIHHDSVQHTGIGSDTGVVPEDHL
jgi:hypothetical protein